MAADGQARRPSATLVEAAKRPCDRKMTTRPSRAIRELAATVLNNLASVCGATRRGTTKRGAPRPSHLHPGEARRHGPDRSWLSARSSPQMCDSSANFLRPGKPSTRLRPSTARNSPSSRGWLPSNPRSSITGSVMARPSTISATCSVNAAIPRRACRWSGSAIQQLEGLYRSNVKNPYYRQAFSYAYWTLASMLIDLKDHLAAAQAVAEYLADRAQRYRRIVRVRRFSLPIGQLCRDDPAVPATERESAGANVRRPGDGRRTPPSATASETQNSSKRPPPTNRSARATTSGASFARSRPWPRQRARPHDPC